MSGPLSVFLLTRSLNVGGAQRQLIYLARGLARRGHRVTVAVFYPGVLDHELAAAGVRLIDLGKKGRWDVAGFMARLVCALRQVRPDVLYCFLGTANILGAAVRPFLPPIRLVWSIRASNMDLANYDRLARASYWGECSLSRTADLVISNSAAGAAFAIANGFPRDRTVVVENGVDADQFTPDPQARAHTRRQWGFADDDVLVGVLARLDPMKDHPTFVEAAAKVAKARPSARFAIVGDSPEAEKNRILAMALDLGLSERLVLPGRSDRPAEALAAFDIFCSASRFGEGFSNAVAEALAAGLPAVVTDVGDSAKIVEGVGRVVPPGDPAALAEALVAAIDDLPSWEPARARSRIAERYSIDRMVERTLALIAPPQTP